MSTNELEDQMQDMFEKACRECGTVYEEREAQQPDDSILLVYLCPSCGFFEGRVPIPDE